jgi:hypothetical protein
MPIPPGKRSGWCHARQDLRPGQKKEDALLLQIVVQNMRVPMKWEYCCTSLYQNVLASSVENDVREPSQPAFKILRLEPQDTIFICTAAWEPLAKMSKVVPGRTDTMELKIASHNLRRQYERERMSIAFGSAQ